MKSSSNSNDVIYNHTTDGDREKHNLNTYHLKHQNPAILPFMQKTPSSTGYL